jgi:hydroxyquinol 1,2-dioxygenase
MLVATGRHPWRPAHLHFLIKAEGCETLVTHLFREGDPYLDTDVVFGVRNALRVPMPENPAAHGRHLLRHTFVLNPTQPAQPDR